MKAIILCAGRGSRLYPFTENCPKCLTELAGTTLIERQIATFRAAGISEIIIVSGYLGDMLDFPGTERVSNADWAQTNMVESLFQAEPKFDDDIIVSYGDIVFEPRILSAILDSPHAISVAVDRQWRPYWEMRFAYPLSDAESLSLTSDGRILDIGQPVKTIDAIEGQYLGLMRFRQDGIDDLRRCKASLGDIRRPWLDKRSVKNAYMTDLLMEMVLTEIPVFAVPVDGGWLEIDTPSDFELASSILSRQAERSFPGMISFSN